MKVFVSMHNSFCGKEKIAGILKKEDAKIHFCGVGGIGMSSLFILTCNMGREASGSDREESRYTRLLNERYGRIYIGHRSSNVYGADLLVYTLAVDEKNPELVFARENGIPAVSRADYLGAIMENYNVRIGVSGTHGKSTVTAMTSDIFVLAEKNPTTVLGAKLPDSDLPLRVGGKNVMIYEACEYKDSFLAFSPTISIFNNAELDHADYFSGIEEIKSSFLKAINKSHTAIINGDDPILHSLIGGIETDYATFGEISDADYRIVDVNNENGFYSFKILHGYRLTDKISLSVPGKFNLLNAAAAYAAADRAGIRSDVAISALSRFSGIERRMEKKGSFNSADVFYDYAHHPTEIRNTIKTLKEMNYRNIAVVFKPHTYSRTKALFRGFVDSLRLADKVYLCEISAIREKEIKGLNSELLVREIGEKAEFCCEKDIKKSILKNKFDAIVIMGAANLDEICKQLLT